MAKLSIQVEGMHCGACATGIQMITEGLDGVSKSFVDYDKKEGEIEFDPGQVSKDDIFKSIAELGYTATEK